MNAESLMLQLAAIMTIGVYEAGSAVFSQGDEGKEWIIIMSGQVMIQITKTGLAKDMFKICSLTGGAGFGELALINDAPRTASIITELKSELIRVAKGYGIPDFVMFR
jgi:CRP-like cAMP-binding protein